MCFLCPTEQKIPRKCSGGFCMVVDRMRGILILQYKGRDQGADFLNINL